MTMARTLLTCRWTARRIQRYLDADPAAPLSAAEAVRLSGHIETCARCGQKLTEHRLLGRALAQWSTAKMPEPAAVDRLQLLADRIVRGEVR